MEINHEHLKIGFATYEKLGFSKYIRNPDEAKSCIYMGIYKALKTFNPEKGKISTHIYHNVRWECLEYIEKNTPRQILCPDLSLVVQPENKHPPIEEKYAPLYDLFVVKLSKREVAARYNMSLKELRKHVKFLKYEFLTDIGF